MKILLVDDSEDQLHLNIMVVEKEFPEAEIITADDGLNALKVFDDDIDLILTDLQMPYVNGDELAQELRHRGSKVKIVLLSSTPEDARNKENFNLIMRKILLVTDFHKIKEMYAS